MPPTLRIVTVLMGAGFALQGVGWLVVPERAAASLGMPVLDGLARSTQFGDFAAFFLTLGLSILAGIGLADRARLLYFPAALLGSAAFGRVVAWAVHGAAFATTFILVEIVATLLPARRGSPNGYVVPHAHAHLDDLWVLWGSELSPFALKVEALLRFAGVRFRWLPASGRASSTALRFDRRRRRLVAGRLPLTWPQMTDARRVSAGAVPLRPWRGESLRFVRHRALARRARAASERARHAVPAARGSGAALRGTSHR